MRRRRTLDDYALVAGVLVGYVAWSAGGWRWLVPPCVLFAAYTVLWPRRAQLRERPHDMIAVFSVTATGTGTLTYQWQIKPQVAFAAWEQLVGAVGSTLTIGPINSGDAGQYRCVVTNECGLDRSAAARVIVN